MGSKQSGTTTSTQNTTPWSEQQPYLKDIFGRARNLYEGTPPQYYPGTTTAGKSPSHQIGLDWMTQTAESPSASPWEAGMFNSGLINGDYANSNPATGLYSDFAGTNWADNTRDNRGASNMQWFAGTNLADTDDNDTLRSYARGEHLKDNPYTNDLLDTIDSRVLPGIQSQFINGGSLSSPEAARASAAGVAAAEASPLFQNYQNEEANQIGAANSLSNRHLQGGGIQAGAANNLANQELQGRGQQLQGAGGLDSSYRAGMDNRIQGLGLAPQTYQSLYAPGQAMFGVGNYEQQFDQQGINDAVQRWNFNESQPWDLLNQYIGQVTGNYGGTTTLNQPFFTNPTQSIFSGLGAAGSLGSLFGGL